MAMEMNLAAAGVPRSRTVHEFVRETVRGAILDGSLPQGTRLVQSEVAERLGVSITPVREALRDLATERLVVIDPHRGALVRRLDLTEVREIYELRMTLEPIMVRRVIGNISEQTLDRAQDLQQQMLHETDTAVWTQLNRDFHALFTSPDSHSRLCAILDGLRDSATPYVGLSLRARPQQVPQANHEHAQLVELFRTADVEAAVALTLQHLQATLAAIEEMPAD
jgi:DNA-binding GntR family transcriptional regulator